MHRVYTKTGDDGTTALLYGGRAPKSALLFDAVGDIDEAVSALGVARFGSAGGPHAELLLRVQRELFIVAADLAANPAHRDRLVPGTSLVESGMVIALENVIDALTAAQPLRPVFVVPGTTALEAAIDVARTIVRRAERHTVGLRDAGHPVSDDVLAYLNRLSDLLYVVARHAAEGEAEPASHS